MKEMQTRKKSEMGLGFFSESTFLLTFDNIIVVVSSLSKVSGEYPMEKLRVVK